MLDERKAAVLGALVEEYIRTGEPVSSRAVLDHSELTCSSATIRNELVVLEREGLIIKPHTSAGRIPTEKGYRYFVEQLMGDLRLPVDERRMIEHQFYQAQLDLEQWMQLAAAALAHASRGAAVVASPRVHRSRFKHMELISTHGATVLLIVVLQEGMVQQQLLTLISGLLNVRFEARPRPGDTTPPPGPPAWPADLAHNTAARVQEAIGLGDVGSLFQLAEELTDNPAAPRADVDSMAMMARLFDFDGLRRLCERLEAVR